MPWSVYAGDEHWIPPLLAERRLHLSRRNPYFAHAEAAFWVAYRGDQPAGRISAQVDRLHLEQHGDDTGHFGFVEAVDDAAVFRGLFGAAEAWLRERSMKRALGPFSLSINDECGLLVEGFDTPPMFLMGHGRPYYDTRVRELGYTKAMDTFACMLSGDTPVPDIVRSALQRVSRRIHVRPIRLSHLTEDLEILRDIFNDAWRENWGFVPFTAAELAQLGRLLKRFVPPELVQIAEVDGEPAAMIVSMPNFNEILADLDGRLLPFGWARLLWRLRHVQPGGARVPLMGVRQRYHRSSLGILLVFLLVEAIRGPLSTYGVERVELSWVLEDNRPMRHICRRLGAREYKTYRFYEKSLV